MTSASPPPGRAAEFSWMGRKFRARREGCRILIERFRQGGLNPIATPPLPLLDAARAALAVPSGDDGVRSVESPRKMPTADDLRAIVARDESDRESSRASADRFVLLELLRGLVSEVACRCNAQNHAPSCPMLPLEALR